MPSARSRSAMADSRSRSALAIAATLTCLLLSTSRGQQLYVDQPPQNTTVLLGRYAAFHCSSVSTGGTILWFMNETLIHLLPQEYDASSLTSQRTDGINGENSSLTVLGSEQTNGTQYRCGVLEQATTTIVEYSTVATLAVQGIPLPPTGLQLSITFSGELGIKLTWTPPRTLFDETGINRQEPAYVVYVYMRLNSSERLLYRTETASSPKNIILRDLNITDCNLSVYNVVARVSAKFEGVGEGNMSSPAELDERDAEGACKTEVTTTTNGVPKGGLSGNEKDSSGVIAAAAVSTVVGIFIVITIIFVVIALGYMRYKDSKVDLRANEAYGTCTATADSSRKTNNDINETEICNDSTPAVEDQHVYEHVGGGLVKGTIVETHANQAYEPINVGKE